MTEQHQSSGRARRAPALLTTILVLAWFFVGLNLLVDILQPLVDPRMKRA